MKPAKKLLLISTRIFWPPMGGHEVEIYNYCRGIHDDYNYEIDVYAFDDEKNFVGINKPNFLHQVYFASQISKSTKASNVIIKSLLDRKRYWPLQCSLYYSKDNANRIRKLIIQEHYDVILVDMIRLATYYSCFKDIKCKKILDIDDTLSKRYLRQLKSLDKKTNIAGQYNDKLPGILKKCLQSDLVKKIVLNVEIPRVQRAEKEFGLLYDNVIFVSDIETQEFNEKYQTNKAVTISMGVDYQYYSENIEVTKNIGTATFVGNMKTAANADSVRLIVNRVLPNSSKIKKMIFIGNYADELKEEFKDNKKVEFTGRVDDLRPFAESGMVFLSPLAYGTGIKTKILEAMAMGLPVITNSIGAEGIPCKNGVHWLVSDDSKTLGKYLDNLVDNRELCREIGNAAQTYVKEKFQWKYIYKQFEKVGL